MQSDKLESLPVIPSPRTVKPGATYLITDASPSTIVPLTGTSNGTTGDHVDIRCYERNDNYGTGPTAVAIQPDHTFSAPMSNGTPYGTCVLRAVPYVNVPGGFPRTSDASHFTGPTLTTEWNVSSKVATGPNAGDVDTHFLFLAETHLGRNIRPRYRQGTRLAAASIVLCDDAVLRIPLLRPA